MTKILKLLSVVFLCGPATGFSQTEAVNIESKNGRIEVSVGEDLFTAYNFLETSKPYLYPVLGPMQIRMTRDYPMKETTGEADDHPHHKSIWIGHEVNGVDFWTCQNGSKIEVVGQPVIDTKANSLAANSNWIDADGKIICSDSTKWTFGIDEKLRWIDCVFSLVASEGPLRINDTKEGTVAIRTHSDLRLKPDPKRGVQKVFGKATNSRGTTGPAIWGKSASWVLYSGTIQSQPASILMLDHPTNFRHPTTWHARDYGLGTANPFGLHDFEKMAAGAGEVTLSKGQSLTLHYRFVFFSAEIDSDDAAEHHAQFSLINSGGE